MNLMYQLIDAESGRRSEVFCSNEKELIEILRKNVESEVFPRTAILVLMDQFKGDWDWSMAPIINLKDFVELFGAERDERTVFSTAT